MSVLRLWLSIIASYIRLFVMIWSWTITCYNCIICSNIIKSLQLSCWMKWRNVWKIVAMKNVNLMLYVIYIKIFFVYCIWYLCQSLLTNKCAHCLLHVYVELWERDRVEHVDAYKCSCQPNCTNNDCASVEAVCWQHMRCLSNRQWFAGWPRDGCSRCAWIGTNAAAVTNAQTCTVLHPLSASPALALACR